MAAQSSLADDVLATFVSAFFPLRCFSLGLIYRLPEIIFADNATFLFASKCFILS